MPLPAAPPLALLSREREELLEIRRYRSTPQSVALRIDVVLGAANGRSNHALARELGTSLPTVLLWRRRFEAEGVGGLLSDHPRSGRPKTITSDQEAAIVEATLRTQPADATHWSVRSMAAAQQVSPATVHRLWQRHRLQPHRVESFKFSTDPEFVAKVRDIVGLYLHPPTRALVLSVDEKSQIQALDRTQPILPLRPGVPERQTHDYERHGTTTLFAALDVKAGRVIAQCQPRHRHQEFVRFLERINRNVPSRLPIHLILDNYGTHKHPEVRAWFERHPRYHLHYTPTSASWLNQVERWFAEITRKRIRRGTFRSVSALVKAIQDYVRVNNNDPTPFVWTASSEIIVRKLRFAKRTSETGH
jgi:transposase